MQLSHFSACFHQRPLFIHLQIEKCGLWHLSSCSSCCLLDSFHISQFLSLRTSRISPSSCCPLLFADTAPCDLLPWSLEHTEDFLFRTALQHPWHHRTAHKVIVWPPFPTLQVSAFTPILTWLVPYLPWPLAAQFFCCIIVPWLKVCPPSDLGIMWHLSFLIFPLKVPPMHCCVLHSTCESTI